jgi:transposase-like protein
MAHFEPKLAKEERRAIVLHALAPGTNKSELARSYGISRQRVYQILDEELEDAEGKLRAAEAELTFRRRVLEARHH